MNMFEHTITTEAQVEAIWELYSDIASWVEWDKGIVHASLEGAFEAGTRGILQPEGQGPLSFVLTEVVPLGGFSDVTVIPNAGIDVHFDHRHERIAGGTRITHKVTLAGPNSEAMGPRMIEHFSRGIPHTMEGIAAMALERGGRTA